MEQEPTEQERAEALDWLITEQEKEKGNPDIKILDSKKKREERDVSKKKTKKLIADFGQKELFKENT